MPELPEVEIVRQSLDKKIKQKSVKNVIIRNRNLRSKIPNNFERLLKNQKIISVGRFSKYLILSLSNNIYCLIHLGMSGTIHLVDRKKKSFVTNTSFYSSPNLPKEHNHVEIIFENFKVIYNDPRRFGFFEVIKNKSSLNDRFIKYGPEPFDLIFNEKYVHTYLKKKEKCIKNFLLDQKFVSGIGNIYASEILFLCKINPFKKGNLLNIKDCKKIVLNSRKVLKDAIKKGGSSIRNFKSASGTEGAYQKKFKVYLQENQKCKRSKCKGVIKKKIISKRSTYFCNTCQNN